MNILAIETSSNASSIALEVNGNMTFYHQIMPMQQSQTMLTLIQEQLQSHNIELKQLDAIAFGCGPGSFTGLRIAASIVQGLCFPYSIPVIPVSSLAALANSAYETMQWKNILVAIDARMQTIYYGQYRVNEHNQLVLIGHETACKPKHMPLPDSSDWYGVGNAWNIYQNELAFQPVEILIDCVPKATSVLSLAKLKFANEEWVGAEDARPVYLHNDNFLNKS